MEYRIVREAYVDEYGKEHKPKFFIQHEVKMLWFSLGWIYVKHWIGGLGGSFKVKTPFDSKEKAEDFARDFICKGDVRNGFKFDVVSNHKCENNQN